MAIITGSVNIDTKLLNATTFDAVPVSLSYFAENITVLFALGAADEIIQATVNVESNDKILHILSIISGTAKSLIARTIYCWGILKIVLRSVFDIYVPKISIARGVLRFET